MGSPPAGVLALGFGVLDEEGDHGGDVDGVLLAQDARRDAGLDR
jgi:hypothetical protein